MVRLHKQCCIASDRHIERIHTLVAGSSALRRFNKRFHSQSGKTVDGLQHVRCKQSDPKEQSHGRSIDERRDRMPYVVVGFLSLIMMGQGGSAAETEQERLVNSAEVMQEI